MGILYLVREGPGAGEPVPDEIACGDVRDAEELGEAARVRALPHAG